MMIYFDNAATTKVYKDVCNVVTDAMTDDYYNPSSPYKAAMNTEKKMNSARNALLKSLNMKGSIVFTSGGSESNNIAIRGALSKLHNTDKIITCDIEHPSVKKTCIQAAKDFGCELVILPVDNMGYADKDALFDACKGTDSALVTIMHVNNEVGTINDIEALARIAKDNIASCVFHSDGVQAFMKTTPMSQNSLVDLYSVSAHKIHGPKGAGALYIKDTKLINSVTLGGGQEEGLRPGTHNTPGIFGLHKTIDILSQNHNQYISTMYSIKKTIVNMLSSEDIDYIICGDSIDKSAPHILNIAFKDIMGEVLLSAIDNDGLTANTGSACSSKKTVVSPILQSMNIDKKYIQGALRLSFGAFSTMDEAKQAAQIIINNVKRLRRFKRT
jgi:cysteine desulfurase